MKNRDDKKKQAAQTLRKQHMDDEVQSVQHGQHVGSRHGIAQDFDQLLNDDNGDDDHVAPPSSNSNNNMRARTNAFEPHLRDDDMSGESPMNMLDTETVHTNIAANRNTGGSRLGQKRKSVGFGDGVTAGVGGKIVVADEAAANTTTDTLTADQDENKQKDRKEVPHSHKRQKSNHMAHTDNRWRAQTGAAYKSSKAGGDVQRKGTLAPHAYVPLDPTALNRRKKHTAQRRFESVVSHAQKGAANGKQKHNRKQSTKERR